MDHSAKKLLALSNEATDCPICHLRFKNNKAFASGCLHCFCYQCIQNWAQRQATCPLCRKPIEYLIKNVKSNNDYDIEEVVPPSNDYSDVEDDLSELSDGPDEELRRNASTASLESISDAPDESYTQSSTDESNASDRESNEDALSDVSEYESDGNVSDCDDYYVTESEAGWSEGLVYAEHESDYEYDSEVSAPNSGDSEGDESNELYESSDEFATVSAVSSSEADQDSDLLSSDEDRFSSERSSSESDLYSDDCSSHSSDF